MSPKTGNVIIGLIGGAVAGWIVGEILADHFAPEYYTDEELEELVLAEEYVPQKDASPQANISISKGTKKPMKKNYAGHFKNGDKPELEALVRKHNDPDYVEESSEEDVELDAEEEVEELTYEEYIARFGNSDIHMMTYEDFTSNDSGLKQATLHYYEEDDVLTNEKDEPVQNIAKTVGDVALVNFGLFNDDPDMVYVANPKLKVEFEIVRIHGSYESMVLGVDPGAGKKKKSVVPTLEHHNVFEDAKKGDDED